MKEKLLKIKTLKDITDIEVSYSDGVRVKFYGGVEFYDHKFLNSAIVRYFVDGTRVVLRKAVQQIRFISNFTSVFNNSTTTTGGF